MLKSFESLQIKSPFLKALNDEKYNQPTPIQIGCIPYALKGHDILGIAQTGTGKTAAFSIPILQLLNTYQAQKKKRATRALILSPTRELAIQISSSLRLYGKYIGFKQTTIYGGVGQRPQVEALQRGVDIIVATPGRLIDLIYQGHCKLNFVEYFILDEADRMLDMGFINEIKKIVKNIPKKRQTLFFSATMPNSVSDLAKSLLNNPQEISVAPQSTPVKTVIQSVYFLKVEEKRNFIKNLLKNEDFKIVIIFTRTKHGANRLSEELSKEKISSDSIHGNKSQAARQKTLKEFKEKKFRVLVATDVASRGLDIDGVSHVVNYELPNVAEDYIHRIGRTARAGSKGKAISLCAPNEQPYLIAIEKLIGFTIQISGGIPSNNINEIKKKPVRKKVNFYKTKDNKKSKGTNNVKKNRPLKNKNKSFKEKTRNKRKK